MEDRELRKAAVARLEECAGISPEQCAKYRDTCGDSQCYNCQVDQVLTTIKEFGYHKPGRLLSPEEGEIAVNKWVNEDWATRYIRLNRGHWEDIVPVIAQAQLDKRGE